MLSCHNVRLALMTLMLLAGCQRTADTSAPDVKALEKEGQRLRQEHQKEMSNKG